MVVIIDHYDSFTYNLAHFVKELGVTVDVLRTDHFTIEKLEQYDKIILSHGPGVPARSGLLLDVIRTYACQKPITGRMSKENKPSEQAIGRKFCQP
jgi:Anthranilate/para-aminobenzoate synthases component II